MSTHTLTESILGNPVFAGLSQTEAEDGSERVAGWTDGSDTSDAPRWCAPPELTWLGRLLSNRDGGPTALAKALYAVHIVGTALNFVGTDYRRWMGYEGDTGFNIVSAWNEAHGQGWFTTKGNTTADDTHGNLRGTPVLLSSRPDVVLPLTRRCSARFQAVPAIRAS